MAPRTTTVQGGRSGAVSYGAPVTRGAGRTDAGHRMRVAAVGCLSDEGAGRAAIALLVAVARVAGCKLSPVTAAR